MFICIKYNGFAWISTTQYWSIDLNNENIREQANKQINKQ